MLQRDQEVFQGCGVEEYNLILSKDAKIVCLQLLKQGFFFISTSVLQQKFKNIHTARADGSLGHS